MRDGGCHIHFGPGRVGLGLVSAASVAAGLELHLVARPRSSLAKDAKLEMKTLGLAGRHTVTELPARTISHAARFEDLHPDSQEALLRAPSLLLSTAVTTRQLPVCQEFLVDLARRRSQSPDAGGTIFIAAENDPGPCYPGLVARLEALGVDCRPTVVNRVCPHCGPDLQRGTHMVTVDETAEWIIAGEPAPRTVLEALASVSFVSFVPDIEPYETRKRWLVNGVHLAVALVGQRLPTPRIDTALALPGGVEWVVRLERTLIESLEDQYPELQANFEYAMAHLPIWLRHSDPVTRILKRLQRRDPIPFLDDLDRKLGKPIRQHPSSGGLTTEVRTTLDALQVILERPTMYVDFDQLAGSLANTPNTVDLEAVLRYRQLLDGIFSGEEIERRIERLTRAYAQHRDIYR